MVLNIAVFFRILLNVSLLHETLFQFNYFFKFGILGDVKFFLTIDIYANQQQLVIE